MDEKQKKDETLEKAPEPAYDEGEMASTMMDIELTQKDLGQKEKKKEEEVPLEELLKKEKSLLKKLGIKDLFKKK